MESSHKIATSNRYDSLDVLRGMTIALMVIVNNPGSWGHIYAPLEHAAWNGFTPTDLVFPTFLFVVGNAMSFSLKKYESQNSRVFWNKVIIRSILIFGIGLFLNAFPFVHWNENALLLKDLTKVRIMGVLQRIALCYFFASAIIHYLKLKKALILGGIMLLLYWWLMWFFGTHPNPFSLEHNASLKFDLLIFSEENLWKGFGIPFDPEGLLSTIPAIVNVIAGYAAGVFIQKSGNRIQTVLKFAGIGLLLVCLGWIWNFYFPIIKGIWTSSFVIYSTGWDLLVLALLIWIIEIAGYKKWTYFFEVFGKNPLFIFIISGVIVMLMAIIHINGEAMQAWIYKHYYLSWLAGKNASLAYALSYMFLMWLFGYWMDRNKIYIKV